MTKIVRDLLIIFGSITVISACKTKEDPVIYASGVEVSPSTAELEIGDDIVLSASVTPIDATDKTLVWSSSNSSVASVSKDGVVHANKAGSTIITAVSGSAEGSCTVTVKEQYIPVTSVTVEPSSIRIPAGRKHKLNVTIEPSNASEQSWKSTSDNTGIVSVEDDMITAISVGHATVTVIVGDKKATCEVTVLQESPESNEVWYTSWVDKIINPSSGSPFGASTIVSNTYENGKGVIVLSSSPEEVSEESFKSSSALKSISLPESIKNVKKSAFNDCPSLKSVVLQEGVENIDSNAFRKCTSLSNIELPWTLKTLGNYSFGYCSDLDEITIPSSVSSIGEFAFYGCTSLKRIVMMSDTPPTLGFRAFDETGESDIFVPASALEKYKNAERWISYSTRIKPLTE